MKTIGNVKIIGVDAGYGNMKTANFCFPTGLAVFDSEPIFNSGMLVYNDRYYLIGEGHRRFTLDKTMDEDYYVLTLAAIALELRKENLTEADVFVAAGLPLTWVSGQKAAYREYLLQKQEVTFTFMQEAYHIHIVGAEVFPQGFSAIAENAVDLKGITLLCDIGNGTMNLLYLQNGFADPQRMYTEKLGTRQCVDAVKEAFMNRYQIDIDESIIQDFLIHGEADISKEYLRVMKNAANEYVNAIFHRLAAHDYNPALMRLYVVGGGGCLIRNFGKVDEKRMTINTDICATAKGYEYLAERILARGGEKK